MRFIPVTRLAFAFVVPIALCAALPYSQQQPTQPGKAAQARDVIHPSKHSGPPPLAEFGAPSSETPAEQIRRQSREIRGKDSFGGFISDPGRFVDGREETDGFVIIDYAGAFDPFPASMSTAVVVGTVISAKGFVSHDRTFVYSDYRIRVDEILKQDETTKLAVGGTIVASRTGATVRFPSGHTTRYFLHGHGMPKIGAQYLLFLFRDDASHPEYWIGIGAAYELAEGKGFPLDDFQPKLEGIDSSELLARAKNAITASLK